MFKKTSYRRLAKSAPARMVNDMAAALIDLPSMSSSVKNLNKTVEYPPSKPVHTSRQSMGSLAVLRITFDCGEISRMSSFGKSVRTRISSRGT